VDRPGARRMPHRQPIVAAVLVALSGCEGSESPPVTDTAAPAAMDGSTPDGPADAERDLGVEVRVEGADARVEGSAPDLPAAVDAGTPYAVMTWSFQRCCPTDGLVFVRLIDKGNAQQRMLGPIRNPGEILSATFECATGAQICFGAYEAGSISGSQPLQWCLGQFGQAERPDCCQSCSGQTIRTQLECPQGLPGACF
jgi:hypothetical protein